MTSPLPVSEGEILEDGSYKIEALLGQGGMGCVFRATHVHLEQPFAIKFLTNTGNAEAERRFLREARIAANLKSRHIVRVSSVGRHKGTPYIVMEYLEGEDLTALLNRTGPLPVERAVAYVLEACEALAVAHVAGIVHRDVKPSNIMLATGVGVPLIKVLDFGVSKVTTPIGVGGTAEARLTATAQALGSPLYMAPEQINDAGNVDGRADVWSIGVVLYQLLTGTTPWIANTVLALFSSMANHPPTPIGEHRGDVPSGLASVVMQCLEKDRTRRWPNITEFAAALAPYAPASAAATIQRIAGCQGLPEVHGARPTEPMPAPGEASTFGWMAAAPAPSERAERLPLRSPLDSAPVLGAAPVVPARTSVTDTGSSTAGIGGAWSVRKVAIGVAAGTVALAAIVALRTALREPAPVTGPVAPTTQTQALLSPEPTVEPSALAIVAAPVLPSVHPLAPASSAATARPKTATRPAFVQPPAAPAAKPTIPGGSRE